MTRFAIELARAEDDAALRQLLASNPMAGSIEIAFLREPNYFLASRVQAPFHQVVVARDTTNGAPVGVGMRGVRPAWINGRRSIIGYLGDLRVDEGHRGGALVARGYRFFRQLHGDGRTPLYLTVIAEENELALETIAAGRAGLPEYRPIGSISTPAVNLTRARRERPSVEIVRGNEVPLPELTACLDRNLSRRQFAPLADLESLQLRPDDFYVARDGGRVIGAVAKWDQGAFRQTRVVRYRGALRMLRPVINAAAPWAGLPRFPPAGENLRSFYVALIAIDDDDADVFRALLSRMHDDHVRSEYQYFIVGLHESDPLMAALESFRSTPFRARAFIVHFEDGRPAFDALDRRIPYVEVAML